MQPGKLRHRVTIQVQPELQDNWGEPTPQYINVWEDVPAAIEQLNGRETFQAQQINASINAKLTIHWRPGVTSRHRALHQSPEQAQVSPPEFTIYDIVAPIPDNQSGRRWLSLFVICRDAEGFRSGVQT